MGEIRMKINKLRTLLGIIAISVGFSFDIVRATEEEFLRALEAGTPLTNKQTIICNNWLDQIYDSDTSTSFTSKQIDFVNAICSNLKKEMEIFNVQDVSHNIDSLVLFLGATGSGKSTLTDLLLNEKLEAKRSLENPKRINIIGPNTSHDNFSKTTWPMLYKGPNKGPTYADCPGFDDNRGKLQQVKNALYIHELFKRTNSVRFLIVETAASIEDVARGGGFIEALRGLKKMAGAISSNNLSLAVTQHGEDHMGIDYLRQYMGRLAQNLSYYDIADLLEYFASSKSRIAFFSRPPGSTPEGSYSNDQERDELLRVIDTSSPLTFDTIREIQIASSDLAKPLIDKIKTGLIISTRSLLNHSVVTPIELYIQKKIEDSRILIDRYICTEKNAQHMLNLYFSKLAIEVGNLRSGLNNKLITGPSLGKPNSYHCLLKIVKRRLIPSIELDTETDANTDADLFTIRKIVESLDYIYRIKDIPHIMINEDIFNNVFSNLEQKLISLSASEIHPDNGLNTSNNIENIWKDHLVFAHRLIRATKAPRIHSYSIPTTRNSGGMRYKYIEEHYWHLPRNIKGLALGNPQESISEFYGLRSGWNYDRVKRHKDLLEVVHKELKELKDNARLTILQAENNESHRDMLLNFDRFLEWPSKDAGIDSQPLFNADREAFDDIRPFINLGWRDHVLGSTDYQNETKNKQRQEEFKRIITLCKEPSNDLFDTGPIADNFTEILRKHLRM